MHRCESCLDAAALKEILDQELNEHEDDGRFNYCQWETADRAISRAFTVT